MFKKASIVTIVLLLSIVFFIKASTSIHFYTFNSIFLFNRIFCCSFFAYSIYVAYKNKLECLTLMLFILAILYNPFYGLLMEEAQILTRHGGYRHIHRVIPDLWIILNLLSVAVIIYTNYVFKNKKICDTIFGSKSKDK